MKRINFFILLTLLVYPMLTFGDDYKTPYSIETVKKNVKNYISIAFGNNSPSISFLYKYHVRGTETEIGLELEYCMKHWGEPYSCVDGNFVLEKNCRNFMKERYVKGEQTPSWNFEELRNHINLTDSNFKIKSVSVYNPNNENSGYQVKCTLGNIEIEIYHARSPMMANVGLVMISKINDVPVRNFFKDKTYKMPKCE